MKLSTIGALALLFGSLLGANISHAQSPNDDNGHHSFVRQALPFVLGRRAHNSMEVQVLVDLIELRGREAVLRSLMKREEFLVYWTETMADVMRSQRIGAGDYEPACMNLPLRLMGPDGQPQGDGGALAEYVGSHQSGQLMAQFNWYDLTYSSLELDNLIPAYRAYLYMRADKGGGNDQESRDRSAH